MSDIQPKNEINLKLTPEQVRLAEKAKAQVEAIKHLGRNDPCFCGSKKKFKKCHLHILEGFKYDEKEKSWSRPEQPTNLIQQMVGPDKPTIATE